MGCLEALGEHTIPQVARTTAPTPYSQRAVHPPASTPLQRANVGVRMYQSTMIPDRLAVPHYSARPLANSEESLARARSRGKETIRVGVLLLPQFPMMAFSAVIEPL